MTTAIELPTLPELLPPEGVNLAGKTDGELGRHHLSHTEVSRALACPQLWGYEHQLRIEPIVKPPARVLGKAFQAAIEHSDPKVGMDMIVQGTLPETQEQADRVRVDATIVAAAAEAYLERWGTPESSIREFEYRVRLRNPWTGRYSRTYDLLGYADELELTDQGPVLVENKLVGQITPTDVRRLPLDRQISLACYGVWRATGQTVRQVRYRWTRKPSIRQRKGESVTEFCERLIADYRERRDEFYTREELLYRSDEDLVRIEAELWEWAEDLRRHSRRRIFPRNTSHCHEYGGCPFLPLCVGDADAPHLFQPKQSRPEEESNVSGD